MTTASEVVADSLRLIGVLGIGKTMTAEDEQLGLRTLNNMLGTWATQRQLAYYTIEESFTLTVSDGEYSIGSGADFDTTRPQKIIGAFIRNNSSDFVIDIIDRTKYTRISEKTLTGIPRYLYYEASYPNGTIKIYPEPASADTLYIQSFKTFTTYAKTTTVTLPPGYMDAIIYNLAAKLAPFYGRQLTTELAALAVGAKQNIKTLNATMQIDSILTDPFRPAQYNITDDLFL